MFINIFSQQQSALWFPRRAGVAVGQVAARATTARPRIIQQPGQHSTAAAAAGADVVQTADAPETATAAPRTEASGSAEDSSSTVTRERSTSIILSSNADSTKTAVYLLGTLTELGPGTVVRVESRGAISLLTAYKIFAKAAECLPAFDSNSTLTFEVRSRVVELDSSSEPAQQDEQQQQRRITEFFVRLEPSDLYRAVRPDGDTDKDDPFQGAPMRISTETLWSKVSDHACRRAKLAPEGFTYAVAEFALPPGRDLRSRAQLLTRGLTTAQRQLRNEAQLGLVFTVEKSLVEWRRPVRQQQGQADDEGEEQQQQQQQKISAEDAAQEGQQPDKGSSSGDGSDAVPMETIVRPSYTIKAFCRQPCTERKSSAARSSRRSSGPAGDEQQRTPGTVRRGSRPGYVEVPAAEWASLREQLEVVPHLTQQLQTMTRQHEQLLSLLAAQQQGGDAGAAAAEASQQQQH